MSRQWLEELDKDILYFTPSYEEVRLAELFREENGELWYSSELLNIDMEYLGTGSKEEARKEIEDLVVEYFEDEINYYKTLLKSF